MNSKTSAKPLRLGVNIDHVATVRNARGGMVPDPVRAARMAERAGADGITAHLREDRRHISDNDIELLSNCLKRPLNLEMAATEEMRRIALRHTPNAVCIVPERRQERTTESGLDVVNQVDRLSDFIRPLKEAGCRVSVFVGSDLAQIHAAEDCGANIVELHTGTYCDAHHEGRFDERDEELQRIVEAARVADSVGLEVHAGHGLTYETVGDIAVIPQIVELNIGHFLIGEAIFVGLEKSISKMRSLMSTTRTATAQQAQGEQRQDS